LGDVCGMREEGELERGKGGVGKSARRFISSPSKSALYGPHTHSFRRKDLHGRTFTCEEEMKR
jgi:hypothetical protein